MMQLTESTIPEIAECARLLIKRDRYDPDDKRWQELDAKTYEPLLLAAHVDPLPDFVGLEVWWNNGGYRDGTVTGTRVGEDDCLYLLLDGRDDDDEGEALYEVLSAGWLQEPGTTPDPDDTDMWISLRTLTARIERSRVH